MPETINRHCPQCGRKAHDRLLVQCPDCHVPFVVDAPPQLTSEQIGMIAAQVFGSWKFWAALALFVALGAWAVVTVADRMIDSRARAQLSILEQTATNRINKAAGQISNQIAQQFESPRIEMAIEQAARQRAAEIITNGVRPSLEALLDAMDAASGQLSKSSNLIAQLQSNALAAERRIPPQPIVQVQPTNPPPVTQDTNTNNTAASNPTPAPAPTGKASLTLVNYNVVPTANGYFLTMFFRSNNSSSSGSVDMVAGTYKQTAKIVNFSSNTATPSGAPTFSETGDAARLQFTVGPAENPTVMLQLSAPTIVRVESDSLETALTLPVAAEQMQLPSTTSNK